MERVEVTTRLEFEDSEGKGIASGLSNSLGTKIDARAIKVYSIDCDFSNDEREKVCKLLANPVTQISSIDMAKDLGKGFDWLIEVGYLPGVTDTEGKTTEYALEKLLKRKVNGVYTSRKIMLKGEITKERAEAISKTFFNSMIQRATVLSSKEFQSGTSIIIPRVDTHQTPKVNFINLNVSDEDLLKMNDQNSWALNLEELKAIKAYFDKKEIKDERKKAGLPETPTDVEIEVLAQTWSEHCKHKIFNAEIDYKEGEKTEVIDSLFKTYVKGSAEKIIEQNNLKNYIKSIFWDNSGVIQINNDWLLAIKCETHNSPSTMEPYGGSITGIVGVYRDPMGTGKGAYILGGQYYYVTGNPNYNGEYIDGATVYHNVLPKVHPKNILLGVIKGVQDGGNKSGIPTTNGGLFFDNSYIGKCMVYVSAIGLIPSKVKGEDGFSKKVSTGDLVVMIGGRVGIDGIHGATASSMSYHEGLPAGHVQIGDPFTQKKVMDAVVEMRDEGLMEAITDNGAGGLSSSVGEMSTFSGGCEIELSKVPLKYPGLHPWQINVSESQERMTIAIKPANWEKASKILEKHGVEATVLGKFTNSGKYHITYDGKPVAHLDMNFLHEGVPRMRLKAKWAEKSFEEPNIYDSLSYSSFLLQMLSNPNIASYEFITRRYDHEVQGKSVVKQLVGVDKDVYGDAVVYKVDLKNNKEGIAIADGFNPRYSKIDTYHMTALSIEEAIRRLVAVGANPKTIVLNDNFCWPSPLADEYKLAQLVKANKSLYDYTVAFGTPCISGKDSMSIDGKLSDEKGNKLTISGLPAVKFLAVGKVNDIAKCVTPDVKYDGDMVYIVGKTKDELGASEFYNLLGFTGNNVPKVDAETTKRIYAALSEAIEKEVIASAHGCYKGGLVVALAQKCMAGGLGMDINLQNVPYEGRNFNYSLLFSESPSRLVVTVAPQHTKRFEEMMKNIPCARVGKVTKDKRLVINGIDGKKIVDCTIDEMKKAYKSTFGGW